MFDYQPNPIDALVGANIRTRRQVKGLNQTQLADQIGIKYQQLQKYETGVNRVSASRLWCISKALDVDVAWFFEGLDVAPEDRLSAASKTEAEVLTDFRKISPNCQEALAKITANLATAEVVLQDQN